MTTQSEPHMQAHERLSALADGEADAAAPAWAGAAWRQDDALRERWHLYHLIGDAIRSDELAHDPGHDERFLQAFRARLADEPIVIAPGSTASAVPAPVSVPQRSRRRMWTASAAVAAGFVVVAGALLVTQEPPEATSFTLAQPLRSDGPAQVALVSAVQPVPTPVSLSGDATAAAEPVLVSEGRILRDPTVQRYVAAHRQFIGSTAIGVPSGFLRSETVDVSTR